MFYFLMQNQKYQGQLKPYYRKILVLLTKLYLDTYLEYLNEHNEELSYSNLIYNINSFEYNLGNHKLQEYTLDDIKSLKKKKIYQEFKQN